MGNIKFIIEPAEDGMQRKQRAMFENAEHLLAQCILGHTVMMVQTGLRGPAYIERRGDMGTCPVKYLRYFVPIIHLLEIHLLYRRTGNDHTVVLIVPHLVEVGIKCLHVFYRRVLRSVALYLHKRYLHLKRSVREQTHQVCFCRNLQRHQVEDDNA